MFSCSIFITIQLREIIYLSAIIGPDNCSKQPQWGKKLKIWYTTSLAHTLPFFNSTKMIPLVFNLQNSCNLKIFSLTALYSDLQPAGRNAARVIQALEKNCAFLQEHPLCWSTQLCLWFNSTLVCQEVKTFITLRTIQAIVLYYTKFTPNKRAKC